MGMVEKGNIKLRKCLREWVKYKDKITKVWFQNLKVLKLMGGDRLKLGGGGWGFSWEVYIVGKQ
jgi:hypothetical protein